MLILKKLGLQTNKAREIAEKYPIEFIKFAITKTKKRSKDNPAGYLLSSIEDMFELWEVTQEKNEFKEKLKIEREENSKAIRKENLETEKKFQEALKRDRERFNHGKILFDSLSADNKKQRIDAICEKYPHLDRGAAMDQAIRDYVVEVFK